MRHEQIARTGDDPSIVAEITHDDGTRLEVLAERLPRGAPVRLRRSEERRLASLLARAGRRTGRADTGPWVDGELPSDLPGRELCSAHFLSGAGWAWRVTATLARSRGTDERRTSRQRPFRPAPPARRTNP